MTRKEKIVRNKKNLLLALEKHLGIVTPACKEVGVSRQLYYVYYNSDEDFRKAVDEINEVTLDFAETQLLKNIKSGSERSILFYMKYKARSRGYTEELNINANIKMEQPLLKPLEDMNDTNDSDREDKKSKE
jgi:biotin synthase-related radical SAM superfamily protein